MLSSFIKGNIKKYIHLFQLLRGLIVLAILDSYMAGIDVFDLATPNKE